MKKLNFLSNLCGLRRASQSTDVSHDCRLTVGSPSVHRRHWTQKLCTILVLLMTIGVGNAWGDNAIIYSETFGTTGKNTAWSSYSGWSNNTTSSKTSTTSWKVSKTTSDVCRISGSSGSCNAYCGTSGATLVFTFGDISAYSNIVLSFNYYNNRAGGNARTFTCEVSSDGGSSWSSNILASNTTSGWCSTTVTYNVSSAQAANFAVRFTNTSTNTSRIDDVKLTGCKIPTATSNGTISSTSAVVNWTDAENTNDYQLYLSTSSTPPATNATPTVGSGVTSKTYTFTGLTASTTYYWWVRSACSATSKSAWKAGSSFSTLAGSCTAPSSVSISGTTKYLGGQTISLTATPSGGSGTTTYQWQKKISGTWTDLSNGTVSGVTTSGATSNNLQITPCNHENSGGYRCIVSTGATCSTNSHADDTDGYGVHVFSIHGKYTSDADYSDNEITWTSGTTGTATIHLSAKKTYLFKVWSNNGYYYGHGANANEDFIFQPTTWDCGVSNREMRLFTTVEGDYTFTVNIEHGLDGSPYVNLQLGYPSMTHPNTGYVYVQKFSWRPYLHYWYDGSNALSTWGYDPQINSSQYTEICGTEYWYIPVIDYYCNFIAKDAAGDPSNTTGDQHTNSPHPGQRLYNDGSWKWGDFTFYSITYDAGDGSGDMDATAGICPGADQAVAANTFTAPTNYHFNGWTAGSSVTVSGESTTSVPAGATIEDIGGNITLTAQWSNTTAITLSKGTAGSANGSVTATCGTKTLTSPTWVTYSGTSYRFLGYSKSGTPSEIVIDTDGNLVANTTYTDASGNWKSTLAEVTLVAQWQSGHTITWSANGSTYATTFVDTGNNLVLPGSTPTSCDDGDTDTYTTFIGWYSTAAGTSGSPTASISSCGTKATTSITPDANQTYYAVWGDGSLEVVETKEVTLDFTDNSTWKLPDGSSNKVYSTTPNTYTNTYTISMVGDGNSSNGYYFNSTNSYFMMGKSGCYMELPSFGFVVSKIVGTTTSTCSSSVGWNIYAGSNEASSGVTGGSTSGKTFAISSDYDDLGTQYRVQVTSNHNLQLTSLDIYSATAGATGFISSCCSSTAVISVTPTSSSLALDIDGNANTTVNFSKSGTSNTVWLMEPTIDPAVGASFSGWAGTYKTAAYDLTFNATATGTYTIKEEGQDKGTSCSKYGTATITVAANPILTPSSASVDISASCGAASSATDITVNSRYLSSTSITASIAKSSGSGTFKISSDNSTFDTSNKTITGGTSSKATSHIYVRYDAIAEESGSATGTLTLTCGAKEVVIDLSATITCSAHTTLSSANPIQITAANGIWVEAANTVSVSGTCLTTNPDDASVSIRAYTNNAHFQIKTGGTTGEGAAKTSQGTSLSLVTNHSTATWSGSIGIVYKPAAHNTTETATLTVEVYRANGSTVYDTQTFTLYGRSLPENFVIAVTDGSGNWFAIPADMVAPWGNSCSSGLSTYTPYPIEVNNTTTPTAISGSTPSRAVYTAAARTGNANTNPQTLSFKSVPLAGSYYLYGSVSAEGSATNIQNASNAASEKQKWFLDVIDWSTKKYNMHLASDLNTNLLSYYTGSVGQYSASGKKADIYILPATSTCTNYIAPKNITCAGIDATNYTIQFKPDRTKNYEISLNGSSWSDAITSIVNECTDDDHPTLVSAEIPLATYRGQTVYIRVKDAGGCAESTTFDVPDPNVTVNAGTWMTMSGIAGYAFSNSANSIEISGLSSCAGHTVDVSSNNSKISASVNQSTGVVTISMTAGNATAGTHTGTLTFTLAGGTTRTQNISITLITKATQEWDGGDNSHFWDGMLCDEEGILVNPTVYLSYDMYYNGSRISTTGDFNSYSTIYLKDLNTGTNVTAHSMTRLKASDGVYGVDLINLTSYRDLIVGHKYRLVWENHSEDNSIQDAVTNSSGVPYSDCHMDFVYTQDCSSPTLLPGCASGTTADVSWGNTKASCSNYTLEWFDRTESSLTNTSIKDNTSNLFIWAYGASCYEANNNYLDDWIVSNSNNDYKSATYGYQVGGTSVKNYIFTPRLNQLYASAGTSTVYEVTVTLQNTGTANAYAAQCYAVDNTTSSTSVITSGYSATYNGESTTYFVTPQCPTSSTITSTFKVTGLTATSRIGFTCQTQGQKLYVKNVAIKRLVDGDHSSATIAKSEDSYTITGLTTGKTYYATLTCGSSTSNEITFTTASGTPSVAFYSDAGFTSAITEADVVPGTPKTVYVRGTNVYFCGEEIPVTINSCFNIDSKSLEYNSETHVLEGNITVSNICAAADGPLTVSISGDHELLLHCTGDHQIEVVQWATNGLKIESYVIVSGTPSSGALNVTTSGGTYDLSHASLDITSHANEFLKITWNGRVENFRVPVFINSSCNSSTLSNVTEESVIVVNANKTLTINSDLVCAGVEIYPTAKVQFSSGSLTADYIRLYNNGDTWANFAKLDVTGASTISVDNVYADFRINEDRYHYIALPFDIETDDVTYAAPIPNGGTPALRDATNNRAFYVRQYDGIARETNNKATESTYNVNMPHIGAKGGNYAMTAGRGYMIAIGDQNTATGHAKRTLRFPIAMSSTEWTAEKASSKVVGGSWVADGSDNGSARATNKGWNLVGNPFMRELAVTSTSSGISTGHLNSTGSVPMWEITSDAVRYITIYNAASDAFTYQSLASSFTLKPMAAFYIQMNDAKYINFQAEMAGQAAAIPALMREEAPAEQEVNVVLNLSNASQSDKAGVVLHSQYDVAYNETDDADYPKLMSNTQVALWSIAGEEKLASNGLPKTASENIPLGYQAPQAGQYTFTLNVEESDMTWLKHVWLTDLVQNQTYDLLLGAYEFNLTNADKRGDRFLLGIELYTTEEVPTDIEYGEESKEMSPQKFIYNDQMYILRGGVIYDATGKRVREINK